MFFHLWKLRGCLRVWKMLERGGDLVLLRFGYGGL
jgi:hypothetical protein